MHPQQCQRMEWGSTQNSFQKVPLAQGGIYEVEHILEWQLVTKFFEWLNEDHFGGRTQFIDPDPAKNGAQIDFCMYWRKTWNAPAFTIQLNGNSARTAKDHIAWQYPNSRGFQDEFVWLQKDINKPAKQHVQNNTSMPHEETLTRLDRCGLERLRTRFIIIRRLSPPSTGMPSTRVFRP
jgi:hypothetical protein